MSALTARAVLRYESTPTFPDLGSDDIYKTDTLVDTRMQKVWSGF